MKALLLVLLVVEFAALGQTPNRPTTNPRADSAQHKAASVRKANVAVESLAQPLKATTDDKLARYTFWLAVFTGALVLFTGGTLYVAWRQGQQIEREFRVTHRPRFVLRRLTFDGSTSDPYPDPPRFRLEMANVGGVGVATANLHLAVGDFVTGEPIPAQMIEELEKAKPEALRIDNGQSSVMLIALSEKSRESFKMPEVRTGQRSIYFVGYVTYADSGGEIVYRTGFLRRANLRQPASFDPVDRPEFEYSE
jgi:hypothetical protein